MSVRHLLSRELLFLVLLASLPVLHASGAQAGASRLGPSWGVDRIHSEAREGDVVTLEGHVVSIRHTRFFTLEDASGEEIVVLIPNHLLRETGQPKSGETIRVRGKYDHGTFLDVDKSKQSDRRETWGIRVSAMDRDVSTSGRNPKHAGPATRPPGAAASKPAPATQSPDTAAKPAPAAPSGAVTLATPNTSEGLKARLTAARKHALTAQKELESANAALARGLYRKVEGAEEAALSASQKRAQQGYDEAIVAIEPLVEEARESGVDPKVIDLYEAGITKPRR